MTKKLVVDPRGVLVEETRCDMKLCLIDGNQLVFYGAGYRLCIEVDFKDVTAFELGKTYSIVIPNE